VPVRSRRSSVPGPPGRAVQGEPAAVPGATWDLSGDPALRDQLIDALAAALVAHVEGSCIE